MFGDLGWADGKVEFPVHLLDLERTTFSSLERGVIKCAILYCKVRLVNRETSLFTTL